MPQTLLFELNDVRATWMLAQFGRTSYQERPPHADVARALTEFEREPIRARTGEGRSRAKARGVRFGRPLRACMDAGLVKGEGFAVDASVIEADASRYHGKAPDEIDWSLPERLSLPQTQNG